MGYQETSFFERAVNFSALRRWARTANVAVKTPLAKLRKQRSTARMLRAELDRLIRTADERLAFPAAAGSGISSKPHGSDWSWRPGLWCSSLATPGISSIESRSKLGDEITLFHDCSRSELNLRQVRNVRAQDLAPYGLCMDVFNFDGSFLSLVLDLPLSVTQGLGRAHLIRMSTAIELENPLEVFARLNVKHGPNTAQVVRELPFHENDLTVEFDLGYSKLNEKRVERAWVDIIFEGPQMNQMIIHDITFARHPRAAF